MWGDWGFEGARLHLGQSKDWPGDALGACQKIFPEGTA